MSSQDSAGDKVEPESNPLTLDEAEGQADAEPVFDPRSLLAEWANGEDEWTRRLVRLVLGGHRLSESDLDTAFQLFLEEKLLRPRVAPTEGRIAVELDPLDREAPLVLTRISDVEGVNALVPGSTIDLNDGLTILFGENGTGKTGYARILKSVANCRTVDDILADINDPAAPKSPSASIEYRLGAETMKLAWQGERGETPFTRMAVFDTPAVQFHVDDDLAYVYTPASLALFNHVSQGVQAVKQRIDQTIANLRSPNSQLLARFERGSTIYPMIETLGAATDLPALKNLAQVKKSAEEDVDALQLTVASLRSNTVGEQIAMRQRASKVLGETRATITIATALPVNEYNAALATLGTLTKDYETFRSSLFAAADLPAEPDQTWEAFIRAGDAYQDHLDELGVHDSGRCLYCRQDIGAPAAELLSKYGDYLADKIALDIHQQETYLTTVTRPVIEARLAEIQAFLADSGDAPEVGPIRAVLAGAEDLAARLTVRQPVAEDVVESIKGAEASITEAKARVDAELQDLRDQAENREQTLAHKEAELQELRARIELKKSWDQIEKRVADAQEVDKLTTLAKKLPSVLRQLTELSKQASNHLINQNFGQLFADECSALRAPSLRLEFLGREGKAQRRKTLSGNHKPSKILSEGEQKVLAIADFLAEARLTGITAPIILDDPVCSLDHRRINEVAQRVALLAQEHQVVVFTHDIFFATTLLTIFEKTPSRCTYYQVTDEDGKGHVARSTGPRWDTRASIGKSINETIATAKKTEGEARASLVRTGYDWLRAWCEVFVERELLAEVTQRYQPNVRMTALSKLKPDRMQATIDTIVRVFEEACRYIDGHSQPLPTLGVAPTLQGLEDDWKTVQDCRSAYLAD